MVEITKHAVARFKERFVKCSRREAREMLAVAYMEAVRPPKYIRRVYPVSGKTACFYHRWSGLLLVCRPGHSYPHCIVTVIVIPFPR